MQKLFGGSSSSSQSSSGGFNQLPEPIQTAFTNLASQGTNLLAPSGGSPNADLFTLPSLNSGSTNALSQIENQAFVPTASSIASDVGMQTDPYKGSVISQIERAQNGPLSALNSYLSNSGTFGSNRGMLGASDISNTAADQIGGFLSGEYNTALNNALTTLPSLRAQSAQGALQGGQFEQQQGVQNKQAPVSALAALSQIMGILPTSAGGSSSTSSGSSNTGIIPALGSFFGGK